VRCDAESTRWPSRKLSGGSCAFGLDAHRRTLEGLIALWRNAIQIDQLIGVMEQHFLASTIRDVRLVPRARFRTSSEVPRVRVSAMSCRMSLRRSALFLQATYRHYVLCQAGRLIALCYRIILVTQLAALGAQRRRAGRVRQWPNP
jgi:hypothetical protein